MTRDDVLGWLDRHDAAWRAAEASAIADLFSEGAVYHTGPWDEPWRGIPGPFRGRDGIAVGWLAGGIAGEQFDIWTDLIALDGQRAVVRRRLTYFEPGGAIESRWDTLWVIDFDDEGRCAEYQEWYVEAPAGAGYHSAG
ncbi:MAG TPA: nuclear transport factor 2 family protein [Candidatus Limnocylindrales bacterium]|nr:nuclear transport factor 2 family protein [Candidatus Limnocylindrales bacterium]